MVVVVVAAVEAAVAEVVVEATVVVAAAVVGAAINRKTISGSLQRAQFCKTAPDDCTARHAC